MPSLQPWLVYALLSALAASLVGIFGRLGVTKVDDNLATTIRSVAMTLMLLIFATVIGAWQKICAQWGHRGGTARRGWGMTPLIVRRRDGAR